MGFWGKNLLGRRDSSFLPGEQLTCVSVESGGGVISLHRMQEKELKDQDKGIKG